MLRRRFPPDPKQPIYKKARTMITREDLDEAIKIYGKTIVLESDV